VTIRLPWPLDECTPWPFTRKRRPDDVPAGMRGPGGPGDLILTVKVGEHPVFSRKGETDDLLVTVPPR
jgi:DnaJ-class molecular chaperone